MPGDRAHEWERATVDDVGLHVIHHIPRTLQFWHPMGVPPAPPFLLLRVVDYSRRVIYYARWSTLKPGDEHGTHHLQSTLQLWHPVGVRQPPPVVACADLMVKRANLMVKTYWIVPPRPPPSFFFFVFWITLKPGDEHGTHHHPRPLQL